MFHDIISQIVPDAPKQDNISKGVTKRYCPIIEVDTPYFVANDLCKVLECSNPRDAVARHVDVEDVVKHDTLSSVGLQSITCVNKSGLYSLTFGSKLPQAKEFKRWVTS